MKKGFTLVEVMVSLSILSLMIVGIYGVLNTGNVTYYKSIGLLELQQQTRQAMSAITRELREATNVSPTGTSTSVTFDTPDESNVQCYLDTAENQIIRRGATDKILANDISSLSFNYTSPIVQIQIGAEKTVVNNDLSFSLNGTVRLRNE